MPDTPSIRSRRNRMIAIAAGAITVVAIVLAFASEYLDLPWKWIRPAAELLLLGELVGLVVLERHQLFEPVHESVGGMRADVTALRTELSLLSQRLDASGQMSFYPNPSETVRAMARALHEALEREQEAPQILRWTRLANYLGPAVNLELAQELSEVWKALLAFQLSPKNLTDTSLVCGPSGTFYRSPQMWRASIFGANKRYRGSLSATP